MHFDVECHWQSWIYWLFVTLCKLYLIVINTFISFTNSLAIIYWAYVPYHSLGTRDAVLKERDKDLSFIVVDTFIPKRYSVGHVQGE